GPEVVPGGALQTARWSLEAKDGA
ncbi:hypothetical protein A2U01_0040364, partial [Trifolium medium]|nr:hypothetical protein [Trifolium medium]